MDLRTLERNVLDALIRPPWVRCARPHKIILSQIEKIGDHYGVLLSHPKDFTPARTTN